MRAEQINCTVVKLLTGRDEPLQHLEWALQNTFAMARQKFEKQRSAGKHHRRR